MLHSKMSNGELKSAVIVTAFSILLLLVTTFFLCYNYDRLAQRLPPENVPADKRGPKQGSLHPQQEVVEEFYRRVMRGQDNILEFDERPHNLYKKPEEVIPFADNIHMMPGFDGSEHDGNVVVVEVNPFNLPRAEMNEKDSSLDSPFKIGGINIPIDAMRFFQPFISGLGNKIIEGDDDLEDEDYPDLIFTDNHPSHIGSAVIDDPSPAFVNQLHDENKPKPIPQPKPSGSNLLVRLLENKPTTTSKPPFAKPPPIPKPRVESEKTNTLNNVLSALEESSVEDDSEEDLQGENLVHSLFPNNLFGHLF